MPESGPFRLVVEGFGAVVIKRYIEHLRAIKKTQRENVIIIFTDDERNWTKLPAHRYAETVAARDSLTGWASWYNKGEKHDYNNYLGLTADTVVIATDDQHHVPVALHWLNKPGVGQILIEKPLARTETHARTLIRALTDKNPDLVAAFDHYYARLEPKREDLELNMLRMGKIREFTFYFLEDGSGGTEIGPLENEGRVPAVQEGAILDMMPHVLAILTYFGGLSTVLVQRVLAGQYSWTNDGGEVRAGIEKETLAKVEFLFKGLKERRHDKRGVRGIAYVGKGISRVAEQQMESPVKLLVVKDAEGNELKIDFRTRGTMSFLCRRPGLIPGKPIELVADPYEEFLNQVIQKRPYNGYALEISRGREILSVIDDMRDPINEVWAQPGGRGKRNLPTYRLDVGPSGIKAPSLEDALKQILEQTGDRPLEPPVEPQIAPHD